MFYISLVWNLYAPFFEVYIFNFVIFSLFNIFVNFFGIKKENKKNKLKPWGC